MKRKFPAQVTLEADEVYRSNRVKIARYYGVIPTMVDTMPQSDIDDTLNVIWAENQK